MASSARLLGHAVGVHPRQRGVQRRVLGLFDRSEREPNGNRRIVLRDLSVPLRSLRFELGSLRDLAVDGDRLYVLGSDQVRVYALNLP